MIDEFSSLLELFAGFGLAVYFLIETDLAEALYLKSYQAKIIKNVEEAKSSTDTIEKRGNSKPEKLISTMRVALEPVPQNGAIKEKPEFSNLIKTDISAFRYDFLTVAIFSIFLLVLSGFKSEIGPEKIPAILFNFSLVTLILCLDRAFSKENFHGEQHQLLGREIIRSLAGLIASILISLWANPEVPHLLAKTLLIFIVFLPIIFFVVRFYKYSPTRIFREIKGYKRATKTSNS